MEDNKLTVRAAERALDILCCFIDESELSLTAIARKTGLNKSTVYRLLTTLEKKGFLIRNQENERYRLGFRLWELSSNLTQAHDPAVLFLPEMERLRDTLDETVSLYVRDGIERIRVQAVESKQTIRRVAPVGERMPLSVGASSKVLLTYADKPTQDMILQRIEWANEGEKELFLLQLKDIRKTGYATSVAEREAGASAIAVPICNRSGHIIAALAVSGPVSRLTVDRMKEISTEVTEAAKRMEKMAVR
ncbi:IclR family transcriptional regulator [Mechercharimyces sp. CAU 1602]|uniref:IclR family transcriptional regulator n=1 Tax=Mechercharimyces sp. CAU 1602 TaxID=2973933 RepID=UPI002162099C|nr:IclR family transcriptional regulator [Mechercharimyces sp. CAU 1602]MCS1351923.1 IclR family transcriptional regulator [Mechercharimyces sp. CAU 1602]